MAHGLPLDGCGSFPGREPRGRRDSARRPEPSAVLAAMERAADWQLANPSRHSATDWTQGAGSAGMMALAGISGNPRYRDSERAMGEANRWQPGPRKYNADDHCIGQTYEELYFLFREKAMIAPLRDRFDSILAAPPRARNLEFSYTPGTALDNWSWCDALFMGPPAWIRLSAATGDARYLDFAVANWWRTTDFLYDKQEHLFYRDSTYFEKRESNGKKVFWSRGNGWVMAGLVRTLQYLRPAIPTGRGSRSSSGRWPARYSPASSPMDFGGRASWTRQVIPCGRRAGRDSMFTL